MLRFPGLPPLTRRPSSVRDELLRPPVEYDAPKRKDNLFLWTVFLLLLVGFSMVCWIGSYLIFSRPELPFSYRLLRKIKKLDEPQRFKINAAPPGEFLGPERLYNRYNAMNAPALREFNRSLERAFLRNYPVNNELVPYVTGRFTIMETYDLHAMDFVPSGVVALAVSSDYPKLLIEHIYSSSLPDVPSIRRNLQTGMDIELRRTFELSAVLHVTKLNDGRIQLTVMPINYGRYLFTGANGGFDLQPPSTINVAASWPVVRGDRLETASQAYVDFRTRSGLGPLAGHPSVTGRPAPPALKGVDIPIDVTPMVAGVTPPPAASPAPTPLILAAIDPNKKPPVAGATPAATVPAGAPAGTSITVRPALPVNEPPKNGGAVPIPGGVRPAVPVQPSGGGLALQPFLGGPAPHTTWPMYPAGRVPGGKSVRVNEIAALSQHGGGFGGEPVYLTGQFVVRAVGENRLKGVKNAVLRSGGDSNVRLIVEYPADRTLPSEGSEISRDEQRPYQIMEVRRVADGTLNVYAREITEPQG